VTDRTVRWGGVAAIVFVVLVVVTVVALGSPPAADDAPDKIRDYLVDNRSALLFSNLLGLIAIPFLGWFVVVLREVLRGDRTANALGTASIVGVVFTAPMAMAGNALYASVVYVDGAADRLGDDTVRVVFEAQTLLFAATSAGIVLLALAAGLAIRRTGALPAYTMWLAFLAAFGNLVSIFSTVDAGAWALALPGAITFGLFLLVTGITMAIGKGTAAAATP
jgi:hypothetical protein